MTCQQVMVSEKGKLHRTVWQIGVNVQVKTFHCLRMVQVLQVLGAKPLLKGKVSEQLDVSLCNFPPALPFLHHLFQTTQYTQTQFLQCLCIWRTHGQQIKIPNHTPDNKLASASAPAKAIVLVGWFSSSPYIFLQPTSTRSLLLAVHGESCLLIKIHYNMFLNLCWLSMHGTFIL